MTTFAPQAAPGRWISAAELAQESGLRPDLVVRFVPADGRGATPMYTPAQIPLAKFVKQLTDAGTPEAAIDVAVRDVLDPAGAHARAERARGSNGVPGRRGATAAIAAAVAALALGAGWLMGGQAAAGDKGASVKSAPVTVTAEVPPPNDATIPQVPDRVCSEWASTTKRYMARREDWVATDPNIPAAQWSSQQRALTAAVIPIMEDEAADLKNLADRAAAPELRVLLQLSAEYQAAFAEKLPTYVPADHALWAAAIDFANAVNSYCSALVPR